MANLNSDLKTENPKAIEYFKNRGKRYLKLRDGFEQSQLDEVEVGDLTMTQIKRWAAQVKGAYEKGGLAAINKLQKIWEDQVEVFQTEMEDPKTDSNRRPEIARNQNDAIVNLNLINLFKNIYVSLQENRENATLAARGIEDAADRMIRALNNGYENEYNISNTDFGNAINLFVNSKFSYEAAIEANHEATLVDLPSLNIVPISEAKAEALYTALAQSIKNMNDQAIADPSMKAELDARIAKQNNTISNLSKIVDKNLFDQIKNRVDSKINSTRQQNTTAPQQTRGQGEQNTTAPQQTRGQGEQNTTAPQQRDTSLDESRIKFRGQLSAALNKMFEAAKKRYQTPNWPIDEYNQLLAIKMDLVSNKFSELGNEKFAIDTELCREFTARVKNYFGTELYETLSTVIDAVNKSIEVNNLPDDQITEVNEQEIFALINKAKNCDMAKNGQLKITQTDNHVEFEFADSRVAKYSMTILKDNVYNKLHGEQNTTAPQQTRGQGEQNTTAPQQTRGQGEQNTTAPQQTRGQGEQNTTAPQQTATQGMDETKDIEYYLNLLRETNALIANINEINRQLVISYRFSDLDMASILNDVRAENVARYSSTLLTSKKLELSEKRFEYLKKYGKYILSNDSVRNAKLDDVKFGTELLDFLNKRDELIVDAELKIAELQAKKPQNYEQDTQNLLEFIKAQNSIIRRFLIVEAATKDIDMIALLEQRNENRKKIKDAKMMSRGTQTTTDAPQQVTDAPQQVTDAPQQVTDAPQQVTDAPQQVTDAPQQVTDAPQQVTDAPQQVTDAPQQVTDAPQQKAKKEPAPKTITLEQHIVKETKLRFNPRNSEEVAKKITRSDRLFKNSPKIIISLIKNGVRIELSKQLKARLAELNAKIALVNKENKRIRTQQAVDANAEYQDLVFKKDHKVNLDDFTVEVRIPGEKDSNILFTSDEEVIHRSR